MSNRFESVSDFAYHMMGEAQFLNSLLEQYQMNNSIFPDEFKWILTDPDYPTSKESLSLWWGYIEENWNSTNTYNITDSEGDEHSLYKLLYFVGKPYQIKDVIQKIVDYMGQFYEVNRQLDSNSYTLWFANSRLESNPALKRDIVPKMTQAKTRYKELVETPFNSLVRPQLTKMLEMAIEADVQFNETYRVPEKYRMLYSGWRKNIENDYLVDNGGKAIQVLAEKLEETKHSNTAFSKRLDFVDLESLSQSIKNAYALREAEATSYVAMLKKLETGHLDPLDVCKILSNSNIDWFGSQDDVIVDWAKQLLSVFLKTSHEEDIDEEGSNNQKAEEKAIEVKRELTTSATIIILEFEGKRTAISSVRTDWKETVLAHAKELYDR